jgi:tetratricopeptide (TPR) repeat protein
MRRLLVGLVLCFLAPSGDAAAQQLRLKRELPGGGLLCAPARPPVASSEQRAEAERLAASSGQAAILGDNASAAALLGRAARLDPASASIAYRHARALEETGRAREALSEYCRYLSLAPDAPDTGETRARMEMLGGNVGHSLPVPALRAFGTGVEAFDDGRFGDAEVAFGIASRAAPSWADAAYNRAVARAAGGRREEAIEDLRRYLELKPGAPDEREVERVVLVLSGQRAPRSASSVLAAGLVVPGLGQFTTGRARTGALVLGGAAGAAAFGALATRLEVECLSPPVQGRCPPESVVREERVHPYRTAGLMAAVAIGVAGAVEAYLDVRGTGRRATDGGGLGHARQHGGVRLATPSVDFTLEGIRADLVRLRF